VIAQRGLSVAIIAFGVLAHAASAATFTFRIAATDTGLTDTTPFTPVGGNNATTLGEARMNVMMEAGRIWGALLQSDVPIVVDVAFRALTCTASSGTLGQAGPRSSFANFTNAPTPNVYYVAALADSLAGRNLSSVPTNADISASFNISVDSDPACLGGFGFYYGFDHVRGSRRDLLVVALHELGHGLGFVSEINPADGMPAFPAIGGAPAFGSFVHRLFDETLGRGWPQMTSAERMASAINTGNLAWTGARANSQLTRFNAISSTANGRFRMNAPATLSAGSSVSHWDSAVSPSALMEPNLPGSIFIGSVDITACALQDIGWGVTRCPDDAAANAAPIATPQSVTVIEDTPVVITLAATDANNDPLTFTIATNPITGQLSAISGARTVTYTPVANLNGSDTFTFFASDSVTNSATAQVSITITPVNDAPVANAVNASALSGQSVSIALNGSDVDLDALTYIVVTQPASGTLSGTGPNLNYLANNGFVGSDSFTYRVNDGSVNSNTATVSVTVSAPPPPNSGDDDSGGGMMEYLSLLLLAALARLRRAVPA